MIKVFRLSDLIKYFFKFIIPIIIIIICLNIFIKKGEREQQKLQDKETANTNIKVEDTKEKSINSVDEKKENSQIADSKKDDANQDDTKQSDTKQDSSKQDDSKLSKLNEKYKSSKLKSNLLSLFKKRDNENKESIKTKTADENKNKESNNTKITGDNKDKELKDAETMENNKSQESINTETAEDNKNKDNKNKDNKNDENNNDGTNEKNKEKNKNKNKNNNNSNAYYFCINSEIVNLKNVKDETKINFTSLLKKIIQSEFGILSQSANSNKDNDNNIGNSENSKLQTLTEYLLGLTPVQFNKNNKNNKSNGTQIENFKSADGKIIAQDKNQAGNDSSKIKNEKNSENSKDGQNYNENNQNGEDNPIEQAEENVKTEAVSNNVNPRYNYDYNGIKIYNSTKYKLTNEMLDISNFSVNKDKILIYHTHTCESYTPTEKYNYQQSGNFRTTDLNFSVARVGEELKKQLESYNIKVIQNKTYHDYPSYNGSYSRSLTTANNMLNENKDVILQLIYIEMPLQIPSYAPKSKNW